MQQNLQKSKNVLRAIVLCTLFLPHFAVAAELSLGIGEKAADGSRDIVLLLQAGAPVNALEGTVNVPLNAELLDITDAGSPVQFWIERPHLSDTKDKITFSGIIPGGFSGEAALFHFRTKSDPTQFVIDKNATRILLNDGAGTADSMKVEAQRALPAQFILPRSVDDKSAPNPFTPEKAVLPTETGETPSLVFNAHDSESGIVRYEIAYSPVAVDPNDPSLVWESVSSPLLLHPANSKKFIYVKAIDRAGNFRIEEVSPSSSRSGLLLPRTVLFFGIISIVCAFVFGIMFFIKKRMKHIYHNDQFDSKK
jgi:hypothetical protein